MGFEYRMPRYEMLSEDALQSIHEKSLSVLKTTGVRVPHDSLFQILSDYGARVDRKTFTVTFPEETVMKAIETARKRHVLYGRDRRNTAEFGYGKFNFNGTSGQYQIIDEETRTRRKPSVRSSYRKTFRAMLQTLSFCTSSSFRRRSRSAFGSSTVMRRKPP
jgi:trimethylamine:corrinoid methyltransferase-like protein